VPDARTLQGEATSVDPSQVHQLLSAKPVELVQDQASIEGNDLKTVLV